MKRANFSAERLFYPTDERVRSLERASRCMTFSRVVRLLRRNCRISDIQSHGMSRSNTSEQLIYYPDRRSCLIPTTKLFRPVGQGELDLIASSGFKSFPSRLPEQPIFYPVLTKEYAEQIARDWNTKDERSGFIGYVLEFDVDAEYLKRFEVRRVGGDKHLEYWIPAAELDEFNRHIQGEIRVINRFTPQQQE